jgi:hypothetical protein
MRSTHIPETAEGAMCQDMERSDSLLRILETTEGEMFQDRKKMTK